MESEKEKALLNTIAEYEERYEKTRMQLIRSSWILSILLVTQLILLSLILTKWY